MPGNTKLKKKEYIIAAGIALLDIADIFWTVRLGNEGDWGTTNLSVVGYWYGHESELIVWGWLTAALFVSFMFFIFHLYGYRQKAAKIPAVLAGVFLAVAVLFPYQKPPDEGSLLSNIHIALSLTGPLCLAAALYIFTIYNAMKGRRIFIAMTVILLACTAAAAGIFIKYTIISTVLEVFAVVCLSVYMAVLAVLRK